MEITDHFQDNVFTSTVQKNCGQFHGLSIEGDRAKLKRWSASEGKVATVSLLSMGSRPRAVCLSG